MLYLCISFFVTVFVHYTRGNIILTQRFIGQKRWEPNMPQQKLSGAQFVGAQSAGAQSAGAQSAGAQFAAKNCSGPNLPRIPK